MIGVSVLKIFSALLSLGIPFVVVASLGDSSVATFGLSMAVVMVCSVVGSFGQRECFIANDVLGDNVKTDEKILDVATGLSLNIIASSAVTIVIFLGFFYLKEVGLFISLAVAGASFILSIEFSLSGLLRSAGLVSLALLGREVAFKGVVFIAALYVYIFKSSELFLYGAIFLGALASLFLSLIMAAGFCNLFSLLFVRIKSPSLFKKARFSSPFAFSSALGFLSVNIDMILAGLFLSSADASAYYVVSKSFMGLTMFVWVQQLLVSPFVSRYRMGRISIGDVGKKMKPLWLYSVVMTATVFFAAVLAAYIVTVSFSYSNDVAILILAAGLVCGVQLVVGPTSTILIYSGFVDAQIKIYSFYVVALVGLLVVVAYIGGLDEFALTFFAVTVFRIYFEARIINGSKFDVFLLYKNFEPLNLFKQKILVLFARGVD